MTLDALRSSWQALVHKLTAMASPWRRYRFAWAPQHRLGWLHSEALESRQLLAGNVDAIFHGDHLWIQGDEQANEVELGLDGGDLVLEGLNGTTINGNGNRLVLRTDTSRIDGNLMAWLRDGDDSFTIDGALAIGRNLFVWTGDGNDALGLRDLSVDRDAGIWMGSGNNQWAVDSVAFRGWVEFGSSRGDDTVAFRNTTVARDVRIHSGQGEDGLSIEESELGRSLVGVLGSGSDTVEIVDTTIGRQLVLLGQSGDDLVSLEDTSAAGHAILAMSGGDDAVRWIGDSDIGKRLQGYLGPGDDRWQIDLSTTTGKPPIVAGSDGTTIPAALVTQRLTDPVTGLAGRVDDAFEIFGTVTPISLTLADADSANSDLLESRPGDFISRDATFTVRGQTAANATVQIARDGDNVFDDGQVVADAGGNFSIDITLTHTLQNNGANAIVARATGDQGQTATDDVNVHFAVGTVMRMQTGLGFFDIELLDAAAPLTVENFLNYVARFESTILHRSVDSPNVVQGGGFVVAAADGDITRVAQDAPIVNEFSTNHPNIRGTISMARTTAINSATSEWFINVADNPALDNVSASNQYAVFGYVIGKGMEIVDQIASVATFDIAALTGQGALVDTPLQGYSPFATSLSGTVTVATGSTSVTGVGTSFTTQIPADNRIRIAGREYQVASILSNTQLTLETAATASASGVTAQVNAVPQATQYVVVNRVSDIVGAPTIALANTLGSIAEDADTTASTAVAQINVTNNDSPGPNNLSLRGSDASHFEIVGNQLLLRSGVVLDFESNPVLDVFIDVDDPQSAGTPDASVSYRLEVLDVVEP